MSIKIIKDPSNTNAKIEGIDVKPLPLNAYTCGVDISSGGITIFNPNAPTDEGTPTKVMDRVPYTDFLKSDGSVPVSAEDLKADIDLQLTQPARSDNAEYRGLWNPSTNTPDLSILDPAPEVGDFFKVSQSGTHNSIDYEINDEIQYNGTTWDRIPASDPWEYVAADNSYDVTALNNRTFVDYTLTSNKDLVLPALTTADNGWVVTIVNSSNFRLNILSTTSGNRQIRRGGSIQLMFNGVGFVSLSYARSGSILTGYNSRLASNRDSNIFADGKKGLEDPNGLSGWNFQNKYQGEKINWYYVYNQNADHKMNLQTLTSMYAVVTIYKEREFHFSVYTKRQNDGSDYSWYRSRVNYETTTAFDGLIGETVMVYWGEEPTAHSNLKRVEIAYDPTFSNGLQESTEDVLFAAISTDSSAAAYEYDFTIQNLGYINDLEETNLLTKIETNTQEILGDISELQLYLQAVRDGKFFRGFLTDESSMDALSSPYRYEYVGRIDTATLWEFDGVDWYDTMIELSLQGIALEEELVLSYSDTKYLELDGLDDYLNLVDVPTEVMDYTEPWNLGIELDGQVDSVNDATYITLFKRGNNEITLRKGGSNWGFYVYSNGVSVGQANTWYAPNGNSEILVVCTGSRIKYYLDGIQRANVSLNANVSLQDPSGDLQVGNGGVKGSNWTGGINNLMIMQGTSAVLGKDQLSEYFAQGNVSNMSFYPSVVDFIPIGERPYPSVLGLKQVVSGTLENSTESAVIVRGVAGDIGTPFPRTSGRYAFLDGTDNFIEFDNADTDVLDYTKKWAVSMSLKSVSGVTDYQKTILFSRGKNEITLVRGGSNWGFYCYADGIAVGQANTWYAPSYDSRIVVICTGTKIEYYLDGARRANISINANVSNQDPSGKLKLGEAFRNGVLNWYGGVENSFIMSGDNALLCSAEVNEFVMGVEPTSLSYYDNLDDFFQFGLGTYPTTNGVKGNITGDLIGGTSEDFVNI